MKKKIIIIIAFIAQNASYCFSQIKSQAQTLDEQHVSDTLKQTTFSKYLDFILSNKLDTIIQIDTSLNYIINFVTSHKFNFTNGFHDSLYVDSLKIICISNPKKVQDSIIKLTFLNTDTSYIRYTRLWNDKLATMEVFSFRKLNPNTGEPYNGSASFYFDSEVSSILSFNSGQYLIICETRFEPDIRGSMPPGYVVTYFLEIVK